MGLLIHSVVGGTPGCAITIQPVTTAGSYRMIWFSWIWDIHQPHSHNNNNNNNKQEE
jgi:hypothetical protein